MSVWVSEHISLSYIYEYICIWVFDFHKPFKWLVRGVLGAKIEQWYRVKKSGKESGQKRLLDLKKRKQKSLSTTNFLFTKRTVFSKNLMANQVPSSAQVFKSSLSRFSLGLKVATAIIISFKTSQPRSLTHSKFWTASSNLVHLSPRGWAHGWWNF